MTNIETLLRYMGRLIESAEGTKTEMADHLRAYGPASAVKWSDRALKSEATSLVAKIVIDKFTPQIDDAELIVKDLRATALRKLGYLIPSNSDITESIYVAQAYMELADIVEGYMRG